MIPAPQRILHSILLHGIPPTKKRNSFFSFLKREVRQKKKKKKPHSPLRPFSFLCANRKTKNPFSVSPPSSSPPLPNHLPLRHDHARQSGRAPAARELRFAVRYVGHAGAHFFLLLNNGFSPLFSDRQRTRHHFRLSLRLSPAQKRACSVSRSCLLRRYPIGSARLVTC